MKKRNLVTIILLGIFLCLAGLKTVKSMQIDHVTAEVLSFRSEISRQKTTYPTTVFYKVKDEFYEQDVVLPEAKSLGDKIEINYEKANPSKITFRSEDLWLDGALLVLVMLLVVDLIYYFIKRNKKNHKNADNNHQTYEERLAEQARMMQKQQGENE